MEDYEIKSVLMNLFREEQDKYKFHKPELVPDDFTLLMSACIRYISELHEDLNYVSYGSSACGD